jgi:transcription termination/antitermination protein NusA
MVRIRLNTDEIKYMNLFESMTGASITDCITDEEDGSIGFLVKKGGMGLAIGKGGVNIERVKKAINKEVWVMESSDDLSEFIINMFQPAKIRSVKMQDGLTGKIVTIEVSKKDMRRVIGQNGSKIKTAKKLAERHFGVEDIKVKSIY